MLVLTLRTDNPDAEIGLYEDQTQLYYENWLAHRQLAETIHLKIQEVLQASGRNLSELEGIVVYQGPGSFTGLRIGIAVANALGYGLSIPVRGAMHDDWINAGIQTLLTGGATMPVIPEYGALPNITAQRK